MIPLHVKGIGNEDKRRLQRTIMSETLDLIKSLVGKPIWGVRRSNGSSFFIEIGSPHLEVREASSNPEIRVRLPALARRRISPVGEFQLLILDCNWKISSRNIVVTDQSDINDIDKAINTLNGTYLYDAYEEINAISKTVLIFDDNVKLEIEPNEDVEEGDNWNVTVPNGETWALYPNGFVKK